MEGLHSEVIVRKDTEDAWGAPGSLAIDRAQHGVRKRRANEGRTGQTIHLEIADEGAPAGQKFRILDAAHAVAENGAGHGRNLLREIETALEGSRPFFAATSRARRQQGDAYP